MLLFFIERHASRATSLLLRSSLPLTWSPWAVSVILLGSIVPITLDAAPS
jgi:hypothetical protein